MPEPVIPIQPNDPEGLDRLNEALAYLMVKIEGGQTQEMPSLEDYHTISEAAKILSDAIAAHDANLAAHGSIRALIAALEGQIKSLNRAMSGGVSKNLFQLTFRTLEGVDATGIWNEAQGRLEYGEVIG